MSASELKKRQQRFSKLGSIKDLGTKVSGKPKSTSDSSADEVDVYRRLPLDEIMSKAQVRKKFKGIQELAETIESGGLEQPIHVLPQNSNGMYVIAKGERRFRAVKLLNWDSIPAIIQKDYKDNATRIISQLVENIQRDNLPPSATAEALIELKNEGMIGKDIAKHIGMSEAFVSSHISFKERSPDYIINLSDEEVVEDIDALNFFRKLHDIAPDRAKLLAEKAINQGEMSRGEIKRVYESVKAELESKHSDSEEPKKSREHQVNTDPTDDGSYEKINTISVDTSEGEGGSQGTERSIDHEKENLELEGLGHANDSSTDLEVTGAEQKELSDNVSETQLDKNHQFDSEECIPGSGLITRVNVITSGKKRAGILLLGVSEGTTDHVWVKLDGEDVPERFKVSQINLVAVERISVEQAV